MADKDRDYPRGMPTDYAERVAVLYPESREPEESIAGCTCLACQLFPART
jgi:hypothetical protein